jgi:hypothetical protein
MSGKLLQLAKRDSKRFLMKGGFEEDIILKTPNGLNQLSLTGFATKHWISFDSDGLLVNSKNAHVTIDENYLVSQGYVVRNSKGEISLLKHLVSFVDSSGVIKNYVVKSNYPDETLGLIVLILEDYKV